MSTEEVFHLQNYVAENMSKYKCDVSTCLKDIGYDLAFLVKKAKNSQQPKLHDFLEKMRQLTCDYHKMSSNKPLEEKILKHHEESFIKHLQNIDLEDLSEKAESIKFMHIDELLSNIAGAMHAYENDGMESVDIYKEKIADCLIKPQNLDVPFLIEKAKKAKLTELVYLLKKIMEFKTAYIDYSVSNEILKKVEGKFITELRATDLETLRIMENDVDQELVTLMVTIKCTYTEDYAAKNKMWQLKNYLIAGDFDLVCICTKAQLVGLRELFEITTKLVNACQDLFLREKTMKHHENELLDHFKASNWIDLEEQAQKIQFMNADEIVIKLQEVTKYFVDKLEAIIQEASIQAIVFEEDKKSQHTLLNTELMKKIKNLAYLCKQERQYEEEILADLLPDFNFKNLMHQSRKIRSTNVSELLEKVKREAKDGKRIAQAINSSLLELSLKELKKAESNEYTKLIELLEKMKKLADLNLSKLLTSEIHEIIYYLQNTNLDDIEGLKAYSILSEIADAKHTHEVKLTACLKNVDVDLDLLLKVNQADKAEQLSSLLNEIVELKNIMSMENQPKEKILKEHGDKLISHLYHVDLISLESIARKIKLKSANDLLQEITIAKECHEKKIAKTVVEYKSNLAACLEDFDFDLKLLVVKAKEAKQVDLCQLLEKVADLADIKTPQAKKQRPLQRDVEDDLIDYLQVAELDKLVVKAREIRFINIDKVLSRISSAKCAYNDYNDKILPTALRGLKYYEEKISANIRDLSLLQSLAHEAQTAGLIPEKKKTILASAHCNVPCSLMYRYLVPHVYVALEKANFKIFDLWLSLLSKCKGISELFDQMKRYFEKSVISNDNISMHDTAEDHHSTDIYFEDKHVPFLTEVLASYSSHWREIAISIGLPQNEVSTIVSMMHSYGSVVVCLNKVLHAWVTGKNVQTKSPTLENLKSVLRSRTVGLGMAANTLQEKIIEADIVLVSKARDSDEGAVSLEDQSAFKIAEQSHSTTATEGNYTVLFGVKHSLCSEDSVKYQWYKDGKILDDNIRDHKCYGSKESIICIFVHNLSVEGSYECKIRNGDDIISSKPIVLSIESQLDQYREKLNDFYTARPEVPRDTWPPKNIDSYINLALIKQQGIDNAGEYARCTIRGDADDVFKDKERIKYENAFDRIISGARLLIEGRPGSGKTTLVHKVSKDWAEGKLKFGHVRLLFLVHLRGFLSNPSIKLHNILECYFDAENDCDIIEKYASKHNGLGLCFILDGFDEYLPKKRDTYIHKLINKLQLPKAVVIVASRPVAVAHFRSSATRQIEVLGFLKEQIAEYINVYNFSEESKCEELLKYLDHHPNVHHMCYLPIHTAMVCFLCQAGRSLPDSETGIYKEFTICFFLRSMRKDKEDVFIDSIEELPLSERDSFMQICKLAFETTILSKQVMSEKDVNSYFDAYNNEDYLGLINVDKVALKHGFQKLYTFLHLTFQEFLAACYISFLKEEEQTRLVSEYGHAKQMQIVWKFYCGLVKFDIHNNFEALLDQLQYGTLYKVQCSFESQQSSTCDSITKDGNLSFKGNFFTPSDFTAIAFVISNSAKSVVHKLVFDECTLGLEGIDILEEKAGDKLSLVTTLCFHGRNCVTEQLKLVNKLMHALPFLEVLDITNTWLGEDAVRALTNGMNHSNLQVIKIDTSENNPLYSSSNQLLRCLVKSFTTNCSNFMNVCFFDRSKKHLLASSLNFLPFYLCSVGNLSAIDMSFHDCKLAEIRILSDDLRLSSICSRLSLIGCNINDEGVKIIFDAIAGSIIEIIELNLNLIGNEGALSIAHSIKSCFSLHMLNLSCNQIGDDGALAIANTVSAKCELLLWNNNITKCGADDLLQVHSMKNINLDSLIINERDIGDNGAAVVSTAIAKYCEEAKLPTEVMEYEFGKLQALNLSSNSIGDEGVLKIAVSLRSCPNLTSLDLSNNSFSVGDGVVAIADALKNCKSIHSLNLACNSIGNNGISALIDCPLIGLSSLNLSRNSIDYYGAKVLADILKNCTRLTSLDLSSNSVGDAGMEMLADYVLKNCPLLTSIDLSRNSISSYGIKALANALKHSSSITLLNLSDNTVGDDGMKALASVLKNHANLLSLKIRKIDINKNGPNAIASIIKHCPKIQTLEIGNNNISESGIKALSAQLKKCLCLHTLSLGQNSFGRNGVKHLAKSLKNCTRLCTIDVNDTGIDEDGANIIAMGVLKHCRNLQELDIGKNCLGKGGTLALAGALTHCNHLHILDISHNGIGKGGTKALTSALEHCSNLHTLDISHNEIGKEGAKTLAAALEHCVKLRTLIVGYNDIGANGAKELAATLGHCQSLSMLNVSNNNIADDGTEALAKAIKHCNNIHTLDFASNNISHGGAKALSETLGCFSKLHTLVIHNNSLKNHVSGICIALKCCSNLHTLDISHNSIGRDGVHDIADTMRHCSKLHSLNISHNVIDTDGAKVIGNILKFCSNLSMLDIGFNAIGLSGVDALKAATKDYTKININTRCTT